MDMLVTVLSGALSKNENFPAQKNAIRTFSSMWHKKIPTEVFAILFAYQPRETIDDENTEKIESNDPPDKHH